MMHAVRLDVVGKEDRKAAVAAYKERKSVAGVFAVRCGAAGAVWVGGAPDLDKIQNRLWFQLKMGGCPHRSLQAAWNAHGPESLAFEIVERLEDEDLAFARTAALKARVAHWVAALGAETI
ncbi:GIY-YIG nuclease family protein [Azospirillum sp. TSA2s]|nr:GIY-YIG nuclease family protein [Azospirillum sp. TSA2s]